QLSHVAHGPSFNLGHVDQSQRRLVLIGTTASPSVIGSIQHSVGRDQIRGTSRLEAAEISRSRMIDQVIETGSAGSERQQVFAGENGIAAIGPGDDPRMLLARERIPYQVGLTIGQ